ncbi:decaprenylphospho-beta-D-erythro-pentofuranosid-2-ulose 2-reductase [Corynebacterium freiburgense]|uniref:decaprenylphospho-beta-D-erythro-pentofuranosid- 2-ulose 2-reductase n=1 Tax=Corynebacterium freiburgense TaxID=556548 RepID=UPI000419228A|nr:decaprenylphospho-beta-D-erythro-pentofuranosid-2-ulose 2-reductase [Corynebacterium freiburgense]WJZ01390.1 Acetoacetyl-CoA reductase [Corynebacterium freiburgense]
MLNAVGKAQNILLLGGTSEIGIAIVEEFLSKGPAHVTLAAYKDEGRIDAAVAQLKAAGASSVEVIDFDARAFDTHPEVIDLAFSQGDVDIAIVAFGVLGDNEEQWQNQAKAVDAVQINYTGAVSVGVLLAEKFKAQGHGTIVAMSSAAGLKVRRSNFVYGSAKAGLDGFYTQLGEALRGSGAHVLVVRPGQVRTRMSAGVKEAPFTVNREEVATSVVQATLDRKDTVWVHPMFKYVMMVLQHLPKTILRRLPI